MKKKFKNISFIVIDVIVLAFFGFYLAVNIKYKDADNKEIKSTGDFNLQSLLANSTGNSSAPAAVSSCKVGSASRTMHSIGDGFNCYITTTPSSGYVGGTTFSSGSSSVCSVTSSGQAQCKAEGTCTVNAYTYNKNTKKISCTSYSSICCPSWSTGRQGVYANDVSPYSKMWADQTN
jgi:hypothetical protein